MFDDDKKPGQAPGNLPFAPENPTIPNPLSTDQGPPDALAAGFLKRKQDSTDGGSEPAQRPASANGIVSEFIPPQQTPRSSSGLEPITYTTTEPVLGKILAGVVTVLVIAGLGVGGWVGYQRVIKPLLNKNMAATPRDNGVPAPSTGTPSTGSVSTTPTSPIYQASTTADRVEGMNTMDTLLSGEQIDTDQDGLPDRRERELGTDPLRPDTDKDALNDGDEVLVFSTDPLNPDSDADGYVDGEEVLNGYNPLGAGKLFSKPNGTDKTTSTPSTTTPPSTPVTQIPSL